MDFIIGCICGSILTAITTMALIWREIDIYDKNKED